MNIEWQQHVLQFIGGLGFFLFSLKYMSQGLQNWAGEQLRIALHRMTANPIISVGIGMLLAIMLQSSTATIILTIGLVNAGYMTLKQSIGIILGANVGTTLTAFLLGVSVGDYMYVLVALGAFLIYFVKRQLGQHVGQFLFGLGGMYIGLHWITTAFLPIVNNADFLALGERLSDMPFTGVLLGALTTALVQSSSATVGILQGLYGEGGMALQAALPILYGENIGTTLTVILASLAMSLSAKRAAISHLFVNLFGTVLFSIGIGWFIAYLQWVQQTAGLEPKMTIAVAHGTFNVVTTLLLIPFVSWIVWIVTKCVPGKEVHPIEHGVTHLEKHLIDTAPIIAIGQAKEETVHMAKVCLQGFQLMRAYVNTNQKKYRNQAVEIEHMLDQKDQMITNYLLLVATHQLSKMESSRQHTLLKTIRDLERMGDHMENIIELYDDLLWQRSQFSIAAFEELNYMFHITEQAIEKMVQFIDTGNYQLVSEVFLLEEQIDELERANRKKHIHRLNKGICSAHAGIIFTEMMSNLERMTDHCVNVTKANMYR